MDAERNRPAVARSSRRGDRGNNRGRSRSSRARRVRCGLNRRSMVRAENWAQFWRLCAANAEGLATDIQTGVEKRSSLLEHPGVHVVVAPLDRGVVLPSHKLVLVGEADLTGRRRVHRKPRGARKGVDFYEGMAKGD